MLTDTVQLFFICSRKAKQKLNFDNMIGSLSTCPQTFVSLTNHVSEFMFLHFLGKVQKQIPFAQNKFAKRKTRL